MIPHEEQDRLAALNKLRIPGVHFKGGSSVIEEAKIGKRIILKLAETWFSHLPEKNKRDDSTSGNSIS